MRLVQYRFGSLCTLVCLLIATTPTINLHTHEMRVLLIINANPTALYCNLYGTGSRVGYWVQYTVKYNVTTTPPLLQSTVQDDLLRVPSTLQPPTPTPPVPSEGHTLREVTFPIHNTRWCTRCFPFARVVAFRFKPL